MIALAVVDLVRLQLDIIRQLEVFERAGELDRVERLLLVRDQGKTHGRRIAEPVTRGRYIAVVDLANVGDEFFDTGNARLFPVPFEHPDADARFWRQRGERFQLLLRSGDVDLPVEAEL